MYFTTEEIENLLSNSTGISGGYRQSIFAFINSYCEWAVDKGFININPCTTISPSKIIESNIQQLMKGYFGKNQFLNLISTLETKSSAIAPCYLSLILARNGVLGKQMDDILSLEESDIDFKNKCINIQCKVNNSEDYGLLYSSLPFFKGFEDLYNRYINETEYPNGLGTRKSPMYLIPSKYIIKRTSYITNKTGQEKVSPNSILNMINQACIQADINRVSLSKLKQSYRLDLLLKRREKRKLNDKDFLEIMRMVEYDFKSSQALVNLKNFWIEISGGDSIEKNNLIVIDDKGIEFVNSIRSRINFY